MFLFCAHVIEQDACNKKEKALRVPRAVNIGWRFTARIQVFLNNFWFNQAGKIRPEPNEFMDSEQSYFSEADTTIFDKPLWSESTLHLYHT